ncbi:MAG: MmcQ/YjbR family DNA-binding protein [Clostridia bacterium]|nr:MmcQ/YjbR family DNA-binding protein [Clostridia bacterium]
MNKIVEQIFKNKKPNTKKLLNYGFRLGDNGYSFAKKILNGQFDLSIRITDNDIDTEVMDLSTNEPYTLFLADDVCGSFVGEVRAVYQDILLDIAKNCFDNFVFKSDYAQNIIKYVKDTYGDDLEFLWEKFSENAIWRRKDNGKWYALLLTVSKIKLGFDSDEKIEIIDLRADAQLIVDGIKIFAGYHMNKKSWITICLDGSIPLEDIYGMIDESYKLAKK